MSIHPFKAMLIDLTLTSQKNLLFIRHIIVVIIIDSLLVIASHSSYMTYDATFTADSLPNQLV